VQAPQEIIEELKRGMDDSIMAVANTVEDDIRRRTCERVKLIQEALTSGKRWSRTLFEELQFIVGMGRNMQSILTPALTGTLTTIQENILKYDPKKLRHSEEQQLLCQQFCGIALFELQS
jgi:hypothetical protein